MTMSLSLSLSPGICPAPLPLLSYAHALYLAFEIVQFSICSRCDDVIIYDGEFYEVFLSILESTYDNRFYEVVFL